MTSKGKQEMGKTVITRQLQIGDKFKIPGNPSQTYEVVNIKGDYLIYRNVRSHEEFQMVRGFSSKVDLVEESATYQKKRFKEPYYMYNESAKTIKESSETKKDYLKYIDQFEKDVKKYIDWMKRDVKENKEIVLPDVVVNLATAITNAMNRYNNAVKTKTLTESFIIQDSDSNNKPVYFHYGKYTGYDWGFDKNAATKFSTKEAAERMLEKMRQEGMLINSMKVVQESKTADNLKVMDKVWYSESGTGDDIDKLGIQGTILNKSSNTIKVGNQKIHGKEIPAHRNNGEYRIADKHWWKIDEGRIAKGYENLDADEKARHLLSHPSSKYMNDLKSENITERAIRKAVKEMLGKPDKRDPQFITDVNEEGEAPAIANTTSEVANPDLPLKLKEGENSWEMGNGDKIEVKSDVVIRTTKDGEKFMMPRKEWENGDSSNQEPKWRKMK